MTLSHDVLKILGLVLPLLHLLGLGFALRAICVARTSQGAIAWAVSLVSLPYLSVPLYLIFGRDRFRGYVRARRSHDQRLKAISDELTARAERPGNVAGESNLPSFRVLESLARMPFTQGNEAELLVDGEATFRAIFEAIEKARKYVLVQFFIVRDDDLGRRLADLLLRKAAEGVRCYFLFDEVGSSSTPGKYWRRLRKGGVEAAPFNTRRGGWRNRFQINFRNHRKIVIADGECSLVGGHNVGVEYLGQGPLGPWRDTHLLTRGPLVAATQLSFVEDWYWATGEVPELEWKLTRRDAGDLTALALPTGPADETETCSLMFVQLIQAARHRLWIATPYFVPDGPVLCALKLAALRGVDVRVLLPEKADHLLTHLASFAFIEQVERAGVKVFRFPPAFPHQKVVLVDDDGAAIGTANLDNRSLRLNFEITLLFAGRSLAHATRLMLERDFAAAHPVTPGGLAARRLSFQLAVRVACLFSPIL